MLNKTLILQTTLLLLGGYLIASQIWNFPFPSPAARVFLGPRERWPTELVKKWVEAGNPDPSFVEFFSRDPERIVPAGANLVSPADGRLKDVYENGGTDHFTVGLSFWDVHVVRSPIAGIVESVESEGNVFFRTHSESANLVFLKGKAGPVQSIVTISDGKMRLKVRLITSYWASRLKVFVSPGETLAKGQRMGRILLGSTVVVDLPHGCTFHQNQGERVIAGETIITDLDSCL
jgi:phosphatidylserine decarboxylase